jgi:hypothetical protein|tara:strand:+ start:2040 stop:2411 length:372 start_codon:yes stop_codon:yes gene_type:complete
MTPDKCIFIKKIAHGVRDLMKYSNCVNTIGSNPQDETEKFIKKHLLNKNRDDTYEFSVGKFRIAIDMLDLSVVLRYFDTIKVTIDRAYTMASPNPLFFSKEDREFVRLINGGDITTFQDFLIY